MSTETIPSATDLLMKTAMMADPYPVYRQLRDRSPVQYVSMQAGILPGLDAPIQSWALMKHDDVYNALRDHDTFSSESPLSGRFGPQLA
ncbi:MAG: hypothetical protein ACRERD_22855, partial [Candidatus Binatia bacterium]